MRIPASRGTVLGAFADDVDGADWTASWSDVTSWLMGRAGARFGPRDPRWFFTGLEFADVDAPMTCYPANRPFHVGIQLMASAAASPAEAYFQLAQEVVHLRDPSPTHACGKAVGKADPQYSADKGDRRGGRREPTVRGPFSGFTNAL